MKNEILGDKKKRRYNEGLFDIVNKKFGKESGKETSEVSEPKIIAPGHMIQIEDLFVDVNHALSGVKMNQEDWQTYWANVDKKFMSAKDLMQIVGKLIYYEKYKSIEGKEQQLLESLRSDLDLGIMTSSRLWVDDIRSDYVVNHGNSNKKFKREKCDWEDASRICHEKNKRKMFQTILGTNYGNTEDVFVLLSDFAKVDLGKVIVKTDPHPLSSEERPQTIFLSRSSRALLIDCSCFSDSTEGGIGRSREVMYK